MSRGDLRMTGTLLVVVLVVATEATSSFPNPEPKGNSWAPCGFAVGQLTAEGNGSTYGSCLGCNPTAFNCSAKCQPLIDALYWQCDGVYAPQDHYFDPGKTLGGLWNENLDTLRLYAARCGCDGASRLLYRLTSHVLVVAAVLFAYLTVL